jgi:hypothetical protein
MSYTVISDRKVCGKKKGDTLTEKEILENGGDAKHLLASGHIKSEKSVTTPSIIKEGAAK